MQLFFGKSPFLIIIASLALMSCGGSQSPSETTSDTSESEETPASSSVEVDDMVSEEGAQDSQGASLVEERCVGCHDLETVYQEQLSREEWVEEVTTMVSRGARLSEEEMEIVVDYLVNR